MTFLYGVLNGVLYGSIVVLMVILPYLSRKNLAFGVSIPSEASELKEIKAYKKDYVKMTLFLGIAMVILMIMLNVILELTIATIVSSLLLVVYIVLVYLIYYKKYKQVKALKERKAWSKTAKDIRIVDTMLSMEKIAVTPFWFLGHIVTIVATSLILVVNYDQIGQQIPMQMDMAGHVTRYVDKTPMATAFPVVMQWMMLIVFVVIYSIIAHSPSYIDPDNIELSKKQARLHKKVWSQFTLIMGYGMVLVFATIALSMVGWLSMATSFVITAVFIIVLLIYVVILSIRVGQSGSRMKMKGVSGSVINREDDKFWKAGMLYYNREDPAMFVEKRVGIGFTVNFGRPLAIISFIMLIVFIIGISLIMTVML